MRKGGDMKGSRRSKVTILHCTIVHYTLYNLVLVRSASRSLCSDGEPNGAATVNHEAVASFHVQTGECGTVGIVAGGIDDIACTVHFGSEGHFVKVGAADGYGCDRSRCRHTAARNALADTVDCCHGIEGGIAGCYSAAASTWSDVTSGAGAPSACVVKVELRLHVNARCHIAIFDSLSQVSWDE